MTRLSSNWAYYGLSLAAALGPLIALLAPLGMAPLFIVVILISSVDIWRHRCWRHIDRPTLILFAALILCGGVSTLWALDKMQTARTSLVLAGECLGGLGLLAASAGLSPKQRLNILKILAAALALCVTLVVARQHGPALWGALSGHPPVQGGGENTMSRGLTVIAILLVPAVTALWRQGWRLFAGLLWLAGALAIIGSHSLASKLALPTATILLGMIWLWSRGGLTLIGLATALVVVVCLPLALFIPDGQTVYDKAPWLSSSAHHRLTIWRFAAQKTVEKPLMGWALDASRSIPGADDEAIYTLQVNGQPYYAPEAQLPLHPHSAPIQIWLELGAAGALLACALLLRIVHVLKRQLPLPAAICGSALVSVFIVASVSYGIWQSWWQGSLWLSASLVAIVATTAAKTENSE